MSDAPPDGLAEMQAARDRARKPRTHMAPMGNAQPATQPPAPAPAPAPAQPPAQQASQKERKKERKDETPIDTQTGSDVDPQLAALVDALAATRKEPELDLKPVNFHLPKYLAEALRVQASLQKTRVQSLLADVIAGRASIREDIRTLCYAKAERGEL